MEGTDQIERTRGARTADKTKPPTQPGPDEPRIFVNGEWRRLKKGQVVSPTTDLPDGWVMYNVGHGVFEAWPTAEHEAGHPIDNEAGRHILDRIDKDYAAIVPTKEFPNRKKPSRMLVNHSFRRIFKHLAAWDDTVMLVEVGDEKFENPAYIPQHRFE